MKYHFDAFMTDTNEHGLPHMETYRQGLACGYDYNMKFALVALWVDVSTTLTNDDGTPKLYVRQKHIVSYERRCDGIGAYCMNPLGAGRRFLGKIEIDGKMMFLALQHSTYAAKDAMTDGNVTRAVMIVDNTYPSTSTDQAATHMEKFRSGVLPPISCHLNKPIDCTITSESDLSTTMINAMTSTKVYQPPVTDGAKEAVSKHEKDICDRFLRRDVTLDDNDKEYAAILLEKQEAAREKEQERRRERYQNDAEKLRERRKQLRLGGDCDSDLAKEKQDEWRSRKKHKTDVLQVYPDNVPEICANGTYQCPRVRVNMIWNDKFGFFMNPKRVRVFK